MEKMFSDENPLHGRLERFDELVRNWDLARQGLPHEPIAPTIEEGA